MADQPTKRAAVITWDWREQPDLGHLANLIRHLTNGQLHALPVDTGSDQHALVLTTQDLDPEGAQAVYERWYATDDLSGNAFDLAEEDHRG